MLLVKLPLCPLLRAPQTLSPACANPLLSVLSLCRVDILHSVAVWQRNYKRIVSVYRAKGWGPERNDSFSV